MNSLNALSMKKLLRIGLVLAILTGGLMASPQTAGAQLVTGVNSYVQAVAMDGSGNIYAGGVFTAAGGVPASRVAKWDGNSWSHMGSGMNNAVNALAVDASGRVYAGGVFTTAGGVAANRVAVWNGSSWSALGTGTNGTVRALALDGSGNLYVGGEFTSAGGVAVSNIARYNISSGVWSALGLGLNNRVNALLFNSNRLYAGGAFRRSGGATYNRVAWWNPANQTWNQMGGNGANGPVYALAADSSGNVFAGGEFSAITGVAALRVARYVRSANVWQALGEGLNNTVYALAWKAGILYVGGAFDRTGLGTLTVRRVASWNGTRWSSLGNGMNNQVLALVADDVVAGGWFTTANGLLVNYITIWDGTQFLDLTDDPTPIELLSFAATKVSNGIRVTWQTAQEIEIVGFNLLRSTNPNGPYVVVNPSLILAQSPGGLMGASYEFLDTQVQPGVTYYYKLDVANINGTPEQYGPVSCTY